MNMGVGDVHMHVCNTDARGAPGRRVLRGKGSTGMGDRETGRLGEDKLPGEEGRAPGCERWSPSPLASSDEVSNLGSLTQNRDAGLTGSLQLGSGRGH